ncbi:MAG TPA: tetratricopeptide repeat protein [Blastocatellia bacterium]|nr:tetratricopeptide repeat protein [Blastocatellia bacterium]
MRAYVPRLMNGANEPGLPGWGGGKEPPVSRMYLGLAITGLLLVAPFGLLASPLHPHPQGSVIRGPLRDPRKPELERAATKNLEVAQFYLKRKKWAAAENRLQRIVAEHPDFSQIAQVYYLLGEVYRQTNRRELAIELYSRVVEEFPEHEMAARARERLRQMGVESVKEPGHPK